MMKVTMSLLLTFTLTVSGCAVVDKADRSALTKFEPMSTNQEYSIWRYEAVTQPLGHDLDESGEETRMRWLVEYMQMNNLPALGYEILDKKIIKIGQSFIGNAHRIIYTVKIPKTVGSITR